MADTTYLAGVVGVGNMGRHHARVYDQLPNTRLAGVADEDPDRAAEVAATYDTRTQSVPELLDRVDLLSIAVPTECHHDLARRALTNDVHVLVEKPFVADPERGRRLVELADERDLTLHVGHVERFNPAVQVLADVVANCDIVGVSARRMGPFVERAASDGVAMDLMIHDIDIVLSIVDGNPTVVGATGARDNQYVATQLRFDDGVVGQLTASRRTKRKLRKLEITASECYVSVDYIDQTVAIYHQSNPEYIETDGNVSHRTESVVEYPTVESTEPLRNELSAFVEAIDGNPERVVTGEEGLRAVELAFEIDRQAARDPSAVEAE